MWTCLEVVLWCDSNNCLLAHQESSSAVLGEQTQVSYNCGRTQQNQPGSATSAGVSRSKQHQQKSTEVNRNSWDTMRFLCHASLTDDLWRVETNVFSHRSWLSKTTCESTSSKYDVYLHLKTYPEKFCFNCAKLISYYQTELLLVE